MSTKKRTIEIAISINEAFQGILVAATHDDSAPLSLKSVKLTPLADLNKKFGRSAMLEPLPKNHATDLDLATLHILLTTMKSALILTDREGQQYVFRSCTAVAATITPYDLSPTPPIRLINKPLAESKSLETHLVANKPVEKEKLVMDKLAWFHALETKTAPDPPDLQLAHQTCINQNEPQVVYLVTQMVPSFILGSTDTIDSNRLKQIVSSLWLTLTALQGRVKNQNRDKEKVLRVIQVQFLLRLQMLAMDERTFVKLFSKKLVDRSKKRSDKYGGKTDVMTEIISILEHASFVLPLNKTLLNFLQETIPVSIYCSIPDHVQEIFDNFEFANPFVTDENCDTDTHFSSVVEGERVSPPKKKVKIVDKSDQVEHEDFILQPINITSQGRRTNPLIKDPKAMYVGSHFNTKLANISAHYHEVQKVATPSPRNKQSPARKSPARAKVPKKSALRPRSSGGVEAGQGISHQQSPFARRGRTKTFDMGSVAVQPKDTTFVLVDETPVKSDYKTKSLAELFSFIKEDTASNVHGVLVGETPTKNRNDYDFFSSFEKQPPSSAGGVFVGETPMKEVGKENRVVPFLLPAANRKPFSLLAQNNNTVSAKKKHHVGFEKLSSNSEARRMAQEAMAASRRGKF